MKLHKMIVAAFAAVALTAAAYAADATGNWKWSQEGRNGPQEITAKLDVKGDKLTGSVTGGGGGQQAPMPADISEASIKDGVVSFTVAREFNGNKRVTKYSGKLDGDTIKGTVELPGRGDAAPTKADWVATRAK
jgi:hypothetical protein